MYYWSKNACKIVLEEELVCVDQVKELYFGTAFFSNEGLRILKEVLKKIT